MTTTPPDLACRHLASLWPAPARFAVTGPDGAPVAGDPGLARRAAELLAADLPAARVTREGSLVLARAGDGGPVVVADVPGAALPGLLEADLLRMTSAPA